MTEEISLSIPSHPKYLHLARNVMENIVMGMGFSEPEGSRTVLAFDEACSNIIKHSCGGDPSIKIDITFYISSDELKTRIRDFGKCGKDFDIEKYSNKDLKEIKPGGFGVNIIKCVMDKVEYSSCPEEGNVLLMSKKVK
jgi:anti-sigma regulatory factor (Ser/Thr protein kinase)